jgi:hypothetical protein
VSCELMKNHKLATSISPTKNISVIEVSWLEHITIY